MKLHLGCGQRYFEGYTRKSLSKLIELYGFKITEVKRNSHLGTYNIDVIATKVKNITLDAAAAATRNYLNGYLVAEVESEKLMLDSWMNDYKKQINDTAIIQ